MKISSYFLALLYLFAPAAVAANKPTPLTRTQPSAPLQMPLQSQANRATTAFGKAEQLLALQTSFHAQLTAHSSAQAQHLTLLEKRLTELDALLRTAPGLLTDIAYLQRAISAQGGKGKEEAKRYLRLRMGDKQQQEEYRTLMECVDGIEAAVRAWEGELRAWEAVVGGFESMIDGLEGRGGRVFTFGGVFM